MSNLTAKLSFYSTPHDQLLCDIVSAIHMLCNNVNLVKKNQQVVQTFCFYR